MAGVEKHLPRLRVRVANRCTTEPVSTVHAGACVKKHGYNLDLVFEDCKVKRLVVKPGQVLSLQRHKRRAEHWTVVRGTAKVRLGDQEFLLEANQSTFVPVETLHRLENPGEEDIHLIEVQTGDYFGEDDIERLEDIYGRIK